MTNLSLRFTVASVFGDRGDVPTTRTEYIRGSNTRTDSSSCRGYSTTTPPTTLQYEYGPLRACVLNRDLGYHFELDPAKRVYTALRVNARPAKRLMEFKPSGKTIHDHTDTIDTGERKEMFGYTARRVLTRNRQTRDTQVLRESECDGWYIDPPAAWLSLHPPPKAGLIYRLRMSSGDQPRDDYKFTESGTIETGFVMLATRRHKSLFHDENGNSRVHESIHRDEVVEFSEGLLGPDLFVPPRDFKRVPQIPDGVSYALAYRMQLRWAMLKDSLSLPNRIAGFTASR